jgi:hypothetical protein
MFYSIPGVHKASLRFQDVDFSNITNLGHAAADAVGDDSRASRMPNNSEGEEGDDAAARSKVSRRTRVSFEIHPAVLMMENEEIMGEWEQEETQDIHDDIISMFDLMFRRRSGQQ